MPLALLFADLAAKYGLPFVIGTIERWSAERPNDPAAADWIDFYKKHHSLTRTYEEQEAAGEARINGATPEKLA